MRIIREPATLMDAEMEFVRQVNKAGYVIESWTSLKSHWQQCLFRESMDAVVEANVTRR